MKMFGLKLLRPVFKLSNSRSASGLTLIRDKCFINNEWVSAKSGKTLNVLNPATNEVIGKVPDLSVDYLDEAINSAHEAFQTWKTMTVRDRSNILKNWFHLMLDNEEQLAKIITMENGKPIKDARTEVHYAADFVEWFAEEGRRIYGDVIPPVSNTKRCITIKQPIGVTGMITPWNFPLAMLTRKVAPALAAGCTTVVKPSDETPLSALALCELALQAGFPKGVLNVLVCSKQSAPAFGKVICESPQIAKISFTGSTTVGKSLLKGLAGSVKRSSMELGGNAPYIVFNSADVETAVRGVMNAKFRCSGQTCVCPNRLLVQSGIHDEFVKRLSAEVGSLRVGNGLSEDTNQGPLINRSAVEKVHQHVTDAVSKGAKVVTGGQPVDDESNFYQPTVLTNVSTTALCANEETFGPLAPILKFETEDEAIKIANATNFGLAGYFFSKDISQVWRVAERLEVGMVGINEGLISSVQTPFGGIKESGFGREGSKYGIEEYLQIKYMCFGDI